MIYVRCPSFVCKEISFYKMFYFQEVVFSFSLECLSIKKLLLVYIILSTRLFLTYFTLITNVILRRLFSCYSLILPFTFCLRCILLAALMTTETALSKHLFIWLKLIYAINYLWPLFITHPGGVCRKRIISIFTNENSDEHNRITILIVMI